MVGVARIELATPAMSTPDTLANPLIFRGLIVRRACRADGDPAKALLQRFQQFLASSGASVDGQLGIARDVAQAMNGRNV